MKKNLYYRATFQRKNVIKEILLTVFLGVASWPRLLLEVFTRKNFGERYFSFSTAIIITVVMAVLPFVIANFFGYSYYGNHDAFFEVLWKNISWYIFLAGFVYICIQRRNEIKRLPSVFDFGRFSLSAGIIDPRIKNVKIGEERFDIRFVETVIEPAFFFLIGLVLALMAQKIGFVIVFCSIVYSLSYVASYHIGDHFIMDKIDEMICNEELVASFVDDADESDTRGFRPYGRKPADPDMRRKVADSFIVDIDDTVLAI